MFPVLTKTRYLVRAIGTCDCILSENQRHQNSD